MIIDEAYEVAPATLLLIASLCGNFNKALHFIKNLYIYSNNHND